MERKCKQCGDPYIPKHQNQLYCNTKCRDKYHRQHPKETIRFGEVYKNVCPECGKKFETEYHFQTYCCKTCRYNVNGRRKYYNDKKYAPITSEHHRERRLKNTIDQRERAIKNGNCARCLKPKHPDNTNLICDECRTKVGKSR